MLRFIVNVIITLGIIFLLLMYIDGRYSNNYDHTLLFKIDGFLQSLIASLCFIAVIFFLVKPSIGIADVMAELPEIDGTAPHIRLKIVNYSLFKAHDIQLSVYQKKRVSISGDDVSSTLLGYYDGNRQGTGYMQSALFCLFEKEKSNAVQFKLSQLIGNPEADTLIKEILTSSTGFLEIRLTVRHGLSGLMGNYIKKFHTSRCLKSGIYNHGFSVKIAS